MILGEQPLKVTLLEIPLLQATMSSPRLYHRLPLPMLRTTLLFHLLQQGPRPPIQLLPIILQAKVYQRYKLQCGAVVSILIIPETPFN